MVEPTVKMNNNGVDRLAVSFDKADKQALFIERIKKGDLESARAVREMVTWFDGWIREGGDLDSIQERAESVAGFLKDGQSEISKALVSNQAMSARTSQEVTQRTTRLLASVQSSLEAFGGSVEPVHHARVFLFTDKDEEQKDLASVAQALDDTLATRGLEYADDAGADQAIMKGYLLESIQEAKQSERPLQDILQAKSKLFTQSFLQEQAKHFNLDAESLNLQTAIQKNKVFSHIAENLAKTVGDDDGQISIQDLSDEVAQIEDIDTALNDAALAFAHAHEMVANASEDNPVSIEDATTVALSKLAQDGKGDALKVAKLLSVRSQKVTAERQENFDLADSIKDFIGNIGSDDIMGVAVTLVMGFFGGSLMGAPGMGVIAASLMSFLGSKENSSSASTNDESTLITAREKILPPPIENEGLSSRRSTRAAA